MECSLCNRWVHGSCSRFTLQLQQLEKELEFECPTCYEDNEIDYPFARLISKQQVTPVSMSTTDCDTFGHAGLLRALSKLNHVDRQQILQGIAETDLKKWQKARTGTFDLDRRILHRIQRMFLHVVRLHAHMHSCSCNKRTSTNTIKLNLRVRVYDDPWNKIIKIAVLYNKNCCIV